MVATLRSQPQNMAQSHGPVGLSAERSQKGDGVGGGNNGRKNCFTSFHLLLIGGINYLCVVKHAYILKPDETKTHTNMLRIRRSL